MCSQFHGNITSINSYGTNDLIRQGAKPVTCIQDVLEEYMKFNIN